MWINILAVFLGGGLGSISRFGLSSWMNQKFDINFPIGTYLSNLLATTILALFYYLLKDKLADQNSFWIYFISIGFCGGFSTFSTFSFDTFKLMNQGYFWTAILNVLISVTTTIWIIYLISQNTKTT